MVNPTYKINGVPKPKPNNYKSVGVAECLIGCGAIYYFMPYDFFASGTIGIGFSTLSIEKSVNTIGQTNQTIRESLNSDPGFGFRIRAGKEWWRSNRWALGVAGFFQFSMHGSGAFYTLSGQMHSLMGGISFTATFN
jgi:hypothetical protein